MNLVYQREMFRPFCHGATPSTTLCKGYDDYLIESISATTFPFDENCGVGLCNSFCRGSRQFRSPLNEHISQAMLPDSIGE